MLRARWGGGPEGHEEGWLSPESSVGEFNVPGWRTVCSCGWTGRRRHRRHLGSPPSKSVQAAGVAEWDAHLVMVDQIGMLKSLVAEGEAVERRYGDEREDLDRRTAEVVRSLRQVATWQEIGDEFGVTRQAALDRFRRYIIRNRDRVKRSSMND